MHSKGQLLHAQDAAESFDCSEITLTYQNDPALTRKENLLQMDKAFFSSLNQYDACLSQRQSPSSVSSSSQQTAAQKGNTGSQSQESAEENGETQHSIASATLAGTQAPKSQDVPLEEQTTRGKRARVQEGGQQGKIPADIPPANNDDALASQIRYAATQEKDRLKKAQLWNEYRKYKGLPTQK